MTYDRIATLLTPLFAKESRNAWEAGSQNCLGSITTDEAYRVIYDALSTEHYGEDE